MTPPFVSLLGLVALKVAHPWRSDNQYVRLTVHGRQELSVALGLFNLIDQQLHTVNRVEGIEDLAEDPDAVEFIIVQQEFFFAGPRTVDVNGRKYPLIHQPAIEEDFHIASAFEFFKDDLIHTATGVHQRGRNNGETATFLDVAGRTEKALGFL